MVIESPEIMKPFPGYLGHKSGRFAFYAYCQVVFAQLSEMVGFLKYMLVLYVNMLRTDVV